MLIDVNRRIWVGLLMYNLLMIGAGDILCEKLPTFKFKDKESLKIERKEEVIIVRGLV
jgi:hypothetical protein